MQEMERVHILLPVLALLLVLYHFALSIYRLYFSPTAGFPGPKIAALTFWYEGYWDIWREGKYTWKIQEMHRKYVGYDLCAYTRIPISQLAGPIVRINPEELHIQDPFFVDQVYCGPLRRTDKWHWSAKMFGTSLAAVGTVNHDLHKLRRSALNPFFSKSAVVSLEPIIQDNVDLLLERLIEYQGSNIPVNLDDAFTALSADVIGSYCFGESYGFLEMSGFNPSWRTFMMDLSRGTHLMKQFGWAYNILTLIPEPIVAFLHPLSRQLFKLRHSISTAVRRSRAQVEEKDIAAVKRKPSHRTIFHSLLSHTSNLPPPELQPVRLMEEGLTLIGAGTVTTAHTLSTTFYYLLSQPDTLSKLRAELSQHASDPQSTAGKWTSLTQLPYLTAVVNEGLRLSYGVSHRLQRVSPDEPLIYNSHIIPAGTPVSMTNMFIHRDARFFPRPEVFAPERWLADYPPSASEGSSATNTCVPVPPSTAKRFLLPFSKGTRACVGMNLAYAEIYLTLGALLAPAAQGGLDLELFETGAGDVEIVRDFFNPAPREGSKGVRVLVRGGLGGGR